MRRWQPLLELLFYHAPMVDPLGSKLPLGCSRVLPLAAWRFPFLWFWSTEVRVVLGSISWQSGFPLFVLGHFFLLGMGLRPDMKWAGLYQILQPHNSPSKSCCPALQTERRVLMSSGLYMAGWVLFPYGSQGLFICLMHAPGVLAYEMHCHQYFYGMTRIASVYGMCIQWHLYEAARIWQLRVRLRIGWNLFRLTFPLWALCAVNSPRFRPLYKALWEDYFPHLLALESCRSSKFFPLSWTKNVVWIMGVAA